MQCVGVGVMDQAGGQENAQGQKDGAAEPLTDAMAVDDAVAQTHDDATAAQASPHSEDGHTPESVDDASRSARVERVEVTAAEDYIPQVRPAGKLSPPYANHSPSHYYSCSGGGSRVSQFAVCVVCALACIVERAVAPRSR